jgi:hypothetical protein
MPGTETVGKTVREQLRTLVTDIEKLAYLNPPWYEGGFFTCQVQRQLGNS